LTDQQKAFVDEYVKHFNATKAAISVGYSEKSARSQASQILALDDVSLYLADKLADISKNAEVDATWVTKRFKEISDRCMQAKPVMIREGNEWVESGEYEFDSSGANKATEMLGKIIGVFEKDNGQKRDVVFDTTKLSSEELLQVISLSKKANGSNNT
jgi:phage terminase small subunit